MLMAEAHLELIHKQVLVHVSCNAASFCVAVHQLLYSCQHLIKVQCPQKFHSSIIVLVGDSLKCFWLQPLHKWATVHMRSIMRIKQRKIHSIYSTRRASMDLAAPRRCSSESSLDIATMLTPANEINP